MSVPAARPVFPAADRAAIATLIDEALASGALTLGRLTRRFEEAFAARHQARHAVAVSSGTAALEIILRSLGVAGRDVVVPANTFFATAAAVVHAGATPVFADVDAATLALSPATVEAALARTDRCAGVIVVHIGGLVSPAVEDVAALCRSRGLFLVEDAAHAHGAGCGGRPAGSFGHAAAFSFYPTKVITAGEGGMIVTDDEALSDDARIYRNQGKASFAGGDHVRMGAAWRMSELHAAVGLVQLARLDEFISVRRRVAAQYDEALADLADSAALRPLQPLNGDSNFYKYVAMLDRADRRSDLKRRLRDDHGVALSGEVYATPLHRQPVFAAYAPSEPLPVADDVCARHVCLPVHSDMGDDEVEQVVTGVRQVLAGRGDTPLRVTR